MSGEPVVRTATASDLWWHQAVDEAARAKSSVARAAELLAEIPGWLALAAQHADNVLILVQSHQPVPDAGVVCDGT